MSLGPTEFERIRRALADADVEEPLTAREIKSALEERGVEFESPHQVATVLGRRARRGDVEVIEEQPYRYRIHGDAAASSSLRDDASDRRHSDGDGWHADGDRRRTDGGRTQTDGGRVR